MINGVLQGIVDALSREFGEEYEIYTSKIEQGLKEPCFFVRCINATNNLFRGKRRTTTNQFVIQYFPQDDIDLYEESNYIFERILYATEYIKVDDDILRGIGVGYTINDDTLMVMVNYDFPIYREEEPAETMYTLKQKEGVTNG